MPEINGLLYMLFLSGSFTRILFDVKQTKWPQSRYLRFANTTVLLKHFEVWSEPFCKLPFRERERERERERGLKVFLLVLTISFESPSPSVGHPPMVIILLLLTTPVYVL